MGFVQLERAGGASGDSVVVSQGLLSSATKTAGGCQTIPGEAA